MSEARRPYPGPLAAVLLTGLAVVLASLALGVAAPHLTPTAALGVAIVVGLGGAGSVGAAGVPPPHAERVGLRGLRRRQALAVALLLPIALLASEVENVVQALAPAPDAPVVVQRTLERVPTGAPLALAETMLVVVGIVPVLEEWFFRGVLQQGLVARLGAPAGVAATATLFALAHGGAMSAQSYLALFAQSLVLGLALGFARQATGSLLASILLHTGVNLAGVLALAFAQTVPIPGYNAPGPHTPAWMLAASAASVAVGAWALARR